MTTEKIDSCLELVKERESLISQLQQLQNLHVDVEKAAKKDDIYVVLKTLMNRYQQIEGISERLSDFILKSMDEYAMELGKELDNVIRQLEEL